MELTREHYRAVIFYGFKAGLNREECFQGLQLGFRGESPCHATVFKEFCSGLFRMKNTLEGRGRQFSSGLHGNTAADSVRSGWPLWHAAKSNAVSARRRIEWKLELKLSN
ncbi:hypothetical protein TNCV_987601 [Trichonephila clavipes]|nr:hypothetical protein TNCV_987601 [Trichonephila clavipes]